MSTKQTTKQTTKTGSKKEFKMNQIATLWINKSKKGLIYLSGTLTSGHKIIGYFNTSKKNLKEPDIRFYDVNEDGTIERESSFALWVNTSKNNKKYATGKMGETKITGFFNSKTTIGGKVPYLNIYESQEYKKEDSSVKTDSQGFIAVPEGSGEELPF